jgi:hypothetical protein
MPNPFFSRVFRVQPRCRTASLAAALAAPLRPWVPFENWATRRPVSEPACAPRLRRRRQTVYPAELGLCIICLITSRARGYPFEVAIPHGHAISGIILVD